MPEGDTIARTAAGLGSRLTGELCVAARPARFQRLAGKRLTAVEARGKHLFLRFDSGIAIHSHLGMTGSWHLYRRGESWRAPPYRAKLVLEFDGWVVVVFSAPVVELVAGDQTVAHLGPDILAGDFEIGEVLHRARLIPSTELGDLLLQQRVCAGIGNIYKCESLWRLGLNPWLRVGQVDDEVLVRLYREARRMMQESVLGDRVERRRRAVHGRAGAPCRRCSRLIQVRSQGRPPRTTFWCPHCQPGSSPEGIKHL